MLGTIFWLGPVFHTGTQDDNGVFLLESDGSISLSCHLHMYPGTLAAQFSPCSGYTLAPTLNKLGGLLYSNLVLESICVVEKLVLVFF